MATYAILVYYDGNENHFEQVIIPDGVTPQAASLDLELFEPQVAYPVEMINGLILTPDVDQTQIIYDGQVCYGELN